MAKNDVKTDDIDEKNVDIQTITEPVAEPAKPKFVKGTVTNCQKLNIRNAPDKATKPISVVDAGTELRVNISESSDKWLKVTLKNKRIGYCMAEYVTLNS